jgi:hypothetical protein
MKASEHPDQIPPEGDDSDATPPGVVWQRPVELRLPKGTRLLSRLTSPHVERLAPHEYLERGRLGVGRKVAEEEFVVVGNYRVQRSKQEP